jgi:hypothetical protein
VYFVFQNVGVNMVFDRKRMKAIPIVRPHDPSCSALRCTLKSHTEGGAILPYKSGLGEGGNGGGGGEGVRSEYHSD